MTPKEYFRLMGVTDEEFGILSQDISETQLYKMAGNSIVVDCIASVMGAMLGVQYKPKRIEVASDNKKNIYACSMRGRSTSNDWHNSEHIQILEFRDTEVSNALTTVCKDNMLIEIDDISDERIPNTLHKLIDTKTNKTSEHGLF